MNTFPFMLATLCIFALGYRYYSAFIAAKVVALDDRRITPAYLYEDGHNYVPSLPSGCYLATTSPLLLALARW